MTLSGGAVFGKTAWRKRFSLLALLALLLQPILPITLANATDIESGANASSSFEVDLRYSCLTGQVPGSSKFPLDSQNELNASSCPWCLSASSGKILGIILSFNGVKAPIASMAQSYSVLAVQTSKGNHSTDTNPRAPPAAI